MDQTKIRWSRDRPGTQLPDAPRSAPAVTNCYALGIAERYRGNKAFPDGFDITLRPHKINDPVKWKQPRMVFVNSMSDLFHKDIPLDYLSQHLGHHVARRSSRLPGVDQAASPHGAHHPQT